MPTQDSIPTEEDWGAYQSDLDSSYAHERFAGKSISEVLPYFKGAILGAVEDISHMPAIPFRYYVLAFKTFLLSEELVDDRLINLEAPDAASSFLRLVQAKLKDSCEIILPVMNELMPVAEYVALHQDLYRASEEIYGSFPDVLNEIKQLYRAAREPK